MNRTETSSLAIHGGAPIRETPMPPRRALGPEEEAVIKDVIAHYRNIDLDPGYQGHFEERYCRDFTAFQGGGYADSVATGTAALFVALAALDIDRGSEVLVSPITDPGTLSAVILNGLTPRLMDSHSGSYNIGADQFEAAITDEAKAAVIVHAAGRAVDMAPVMEIARARGIRVLEDCSQAHGATSNGQIVGTFGDIAAFSTMYKKAHITGASGGVVFTRDRDLYHMVLAHADRGKPVWRDDYVDKNPNQFLFPALNLHSDEISCAIGIRSLGRLRQTIEKRLAFVARIAALLDDGSRVCRSYGHDNGDSPFIHPVAVDAGNITCSVRQFAEAIYREGVPLNPHYDYLVADWPYLQPHLAPGSDTPNARFLLDNSFALYLNENYGDREAEDIARAIRKVEEHYAA